MHETVDNAPIGIWKLDRNLRIIHANRLATFQSGMAKEALIGKYIFDVIPSISKIALQEVVSNEESFEINNCKIILKDDGNTKELYWDLAVGPIVNDNNQVQGAVISSVDVTERVHLREQREDFIAILTHNLKTPIVGVNRALELLLGDVLGELNDGQRQVISMLARSNKSLLRMVQNLLEVYRYEIEQQVLNFQRTDLGISIKACIADVLPFASSRDLKIESLLDSNLNRVLADPIAIHHLLINLLENAIKFTLPEGTIQVIVRNEDRGVLLQVKDSGIGIPQEDQKKLFKQSWQGGNGRLFSYGTGLGLYLSRQIVNAHGGEISCQSQLKAGTTISVYLPPEGPDGHHRHRI